MVYVNILHRHPLGGGPPAFSAGGKKEPIPLSGIGIDPGDYVPLKHGEK